MPSIHDADNDSIFGKNLSVYSSTPEPADGEVARFAGWLRAHRDQCIELGRPDWAHMVDRAAILLEQRLPAPIPVAERLPGPEDCDADGRCWLLYRSASMKMTPVWSLVQNRSSFDGPYTHWLPANALPVPAND